MSRVFKDEIVDYVASQVEGLSKKDARKAIDAFTDFVTKSLAEGKEVSLINFGTFQVRNRKARMSRNPQTGQMQQIPAKKVPAFKPGKPLKEAVR